MSVVQAIEPGSGPAAEPTPYMNAPPPPFQSSRNDALPYVIAAVLPVVPYATPKKSSPIDCAVCTSSCQPSQF
jgi:hypothetical protein